jgi:TrpR family trp operon transcriptional repressor
MAKESEEDGWRAFIELCNHFKEAEELKQLFDLFFTLKEKEDMANRFCILKALLEEKLTQREIAERFNVSISKITRGSNALKIISSKLREALEKKMA